jgi:hypothetical protein
MFKRFRDRTNRRLDQVVFCDACGCVCDGRARADAHREAERTRLLMSGVLR